MTNNNELDRELELLIEANMHRSGMVSPYYAGEIAKQYAKLVLDKTIKAERERVVEEIKEKVKIGQFSYYRDEAVEIITLKDLSKILEAIKQ